jgi:hypothetical protein
MHKLSCCHPDCPARFKSQHGRTYHMRAVHTNFNSLSVNREHDQGHHEPEEDTDTRSTDSRDTVPLDNSAVRVRSDAGEKILHPYLTGECPSPLNVETCSHHITISSSM